MLLWGALPQAASALNPGDPLERYGRQTWQTESGLPQNTVHAIIQTPDGYLWFGTDGGLVRFDSYQFRVFDVQNSPGLESNQIRSLGDNENGSLLVVTTAGTRELRNGRFQPASVVRFIRPQPLVLNLPGFSPDRITVTFRDREDTLWVGTDSGLLRMRNGRAERFPPGDPLSQDAILSIFEDREGDLWVGTDASGVTMLRDQKFFAWAAHSESLDEYVRCVLAGKDGTIWMGTDGDGVVAVRNGVAARAPFTSSLSSGVVLSLAQESNGDLLVGTPDGLNRVHGGRATVLTAAEGLPEDFIRSLYVDRDGSLWIGTRRGLAHDENGKITTYTQASGLGSDLVGSVIRDRKGTLWVATLNGLSRFQNGTFSNFTVEDGLSSNVITDLFLDNLGDLWAGTQDGGVDLVRGDSFMRIRTSVGGPATVFGIEEDRAGHFWLASRNGIFEADAEMWRKHAAGATIQYGTSDGLRVRECSSGGHPVVARAPDGSIWFAMARGAAELPPGHTTIQRVGVPVVLESISLDTRTLGPEDVKAIPASAAHIAFEYAALSFAVPQKIRYRYRLEGFDRNWIDAGSRRTADYTNLPPRNFVFHVEARDPNLGWSENELNFAFRVEPHYYQTWWFRTLFVLGAALVLYLMYSYRLRQLRLQHEAVLRERNRIAREIHDTLAQAFVGVSVRLELVARLLETSAAAAREQLNEARAQVRNSIGEARRSIWELRSQSSEQQDFASRISNMARQISATSPARVQFEVHGTYRPLESKLEDELLRISQEAVTNAVRHATATEIDIELFFDPKKVRMVVADNGRGFDPAVEPPRDAGGHFGLKGMRERAQSIGGKLQVTSMVGKGTTVAVEAPAK